MLLIFSCSENREEQKGGTVSASANIVEEKTTMSVNPRQDSIDKVHQTIANSRLEFDKIEHRFRFSNIKKITSNVEEEGLNILSLKDYYNAFQDEKYEPKYEPAYYYASQGEWHGLRRYIFLRYEEGCCENYYYNIYDYTGKKINSFIIATNGSDESWITNTEVKIVNDSTIYEAVVDCAYSLDDARNNVKDCDSTIFVYHLFSDGTFNKVKESEYKIKK